MRVALDEPLRLIECRPKTKGGKSYIADGPNALPENSPLKSITSSVLLRFWTSACNRTRRFSHPPFLHPAHAPTT
jgi:hypothetical protein